MVVGSDGFAGFIVSACDHLRGWNEMPALVEAVARHRQQTIPAWPIYSPNFTTRNFADKAMVPAGHEQGSSG
jgi:hypothetical protein